ncbi:MULTISPECIES: hypothetical protein [unclassified Breznakia]|uniref:hypothetical protein n=1 Tax=unclassified Breznakia TaxID=2623764 RepID=UPI002474410E|nr:MULTISPECIES: hypothetical protein [unclassified Breznakia]MDH6367873.1 hypothetical protein [Breznakia sp. PH1-1]MDH6404961.1 hypothetical protein [Breznakia sp. PF1-11]MDH6412676.1 hypothetical protein [Breznakia sp. PFB1-11]MDH6415021.1 hypothetical protein [Breznakia sp. PFB1-14]MDH6417347.1 hypothetical protein [Breznakia sp. PFB1-4]
MDFLNTDFFNFIWKLLVTLGFIGLSTGLVRSAAESLKRTGKWTSVLDEIAVGILIIFVYIIIMTNPASTVFEFVKKPLVFLWDIVLNLLRQVGMPI